MLELSTRPWIYYLSQKYGKQFQKLSDIPDQEFQQIKEMGFDFVWMMGVWQLGEFGLNYDRTNQQLLQEYSQVLPGYTIDDIIGSPYAVTNYTCNYELGSDEDIFNMKTKLNEIGLKLMLDFVPNHSAVDCNWTSSDMDYYILSPKGIPIDPSKYMSNRIAYGSAGWGQSWFDTAQFNYWNPQLRKVRMQQIAHVASLSDGIRCDMAYLLVNSLFGSNWAENLQSWGWNEPSTEFWSDAISYVKQLYPSVLFLAEVYDPYMQTLLDQGFDYVYEKDLYDLIYDNNLDNIRSWLSNSGENYISHGAHFIENHDQPRAPSYFGSWEKADAAALLTFTIPGLRFYWMWQFNGYSNQLDIHLRREEPEPAVPQVQQFYPIFLNITNSDVFRYGTWTYLGVSGSNSAWRLIAYRWEYENEKRLCVINYSDTSGSGSIVLSNAQPLNGNDTVPVTELLSGVTYYRSASQMRNQGLFVVVNPWFGQIFEYP